MSKNQKPGVDVKSQRILQQLSNFYSQHQSYTNPLSRTNSHHQYDLVFDFLHKQGIDLNQPEEIKKELKKFAQQETQEQHQSWIKALKNPSLKDMAKTLLSKENTRFYKSYLVRVYLLEQLKEGKVLKISAENGQNIQLERFDLING
jgi:hypothetical protein